MVIVFFFACNSAKSQAYAKLNSFTTNNGLPSNHIYDMVEDNKGFLWLSSDNGVSRFDGRYFQNFSVKNGLPANEVLQLIKSKDGTIWANSFKQLPAYFDEINNKFVLLKSNGFVKELSKAMLTCTYLPHGDIKFYNQNGYFTVRNRTIIAQGDNNKDYTLTFATHKNYKAEIKNKTLQNNTYLSIMYIKAGHKIIDSIVLTSKVPFSRDIFHNNAVYIFTSKNIFFKIHSFREQYPRYKIDTVVCTEQMVNHKFSYSNLCLIGKSGKIYIYDTHTLSLKNVVQNALAINCAYTDQYNNLWLSTLDKGLIYYGKSLLKEIKIPKNYAYLNFSTLALGHNNELLAGNYYGQILKISKTGLSKEEIQIPSYQKWIRKIISTPEQTVVINDMGYSLNYGKIIPIVEKSGYVSLLKTAKKLNDSVIVFGSIRGLIKLNTHTGKITPLNSIKDRTLDLTLTKEGLLYYIGPKGLYKYFPAQDSSVFIKLTDPQLRDEKLSHLTYTSNGTLWASTYSGKLIVFKNDKVMGQIINGVYLPENVTTMLAYKDKIWLGSNNGISILSYAVKNEAINYSITNISETDGLPSNTINDFIVKNDTVYAATQEGISAIPAGYQKTKFEIIPQLTAVKVNQNSQPIAEHYTLEPKENNITLQFSGIELSGHFKNLQYAVNDKKNWNNLDGNTLNMQLSNGENNIYIRAIDINNQISSKNLSLSFYLKVPFFQTRWFWVICSILITTLIFWWLNRRKLAQQSIIFEKKIALEDQRKKITADLHDDIGATLSSLQLNSAVAKQLINNDDIRQAKKILAKIEAQAQNLADKIGDIIWSMKPGKDEFMTITSRIKNFATDILTAKNINYKAKIDPEANTLIKDIGTRKNIVLITKEAINNIAKYSCATEVQINLLIKGNLIELQIEDNGKGFDVCEKKGNGLRNMRKRAEELNGVFNIVSGQNSGTRIEVSIPVLP